MNLERLSVLYGRRKDFSPQAPVVGPYLRVSLLTIPSDLLL